MTPKQTKDMLPIIEAFANNKTIQVKLTNSSKWEDAENLNFQLDRHMYRIKPEKELVPFTSDDFKKLLNVDIIPKEGNINQGITHIISVGIYGVHLEKQDNGFQWFTSYQDLLDKYMLSPTEPCGKYITRD